MSEPSHVCIPAHILPPTFVEDLIEAMAVDAAANLVQRPLTVREKRQVRRGMRVLIPCSCGACLYCETWLCTACAEKHFGQTREEYISSPKVAEAPANK